MNFKNRIKNENKRTAWMFEFSQLVEKLKPTEKGKIDWFTATYFYNTGISAIDAAHRYVKPGGGD